ncbi:MoxR family ATPase [Arsenicicoccus piscis]|uniref:AAA+ ATPase domain-containing protein n=1 Tax=Arsenicicoccus piscis TaxID=673954 RepID=A0ABQ6HN73_9MICO|nr:MoxR family ATPase [Arsenicicoccus piscis]MCH8627115.1 MoxR family ATPase [Arsenicicoccus piscis]GMA18934.1 hypothetical protein GCM10025862_09550 [Arsenicicoccus piscis]
MDSPQTLAHDGGTPPALAPDAAAVAARIVEAVCSVIEGKPEEVRTAVVVLLAGGHLLLEDVPGVGKTMLAKSLAKATGTTVRRVQCTPDLLPSDITGVSIFNQQTQAFEFRPGAVFTNVLIGDEINRASPKTQSALLEAMEERQVSSDGHTYPLPRPFLVVATQNPIEMEGTYPLPEAQRDRFMARISLGYPTADAELAMLASHGDSDPLAGLTAVTDAAELAALIASVRAVHASPAAQRYVVELCRASRQTTALRLGASPRAGLQLLQAAKAEAVLAGRDHVLPDDIQAMALPVLVHRLIPAGGPGHRGVEDVVRELVRVTPVPSAAPGPSR